MDTVLVTMSEKGPLRRAPFQDCHSHMMTRSDRDDANASIISSKEPVKTRLGPARFPAEDFVDTLHAISMHRPEQFAVTMDELHSAFLEDFAGVYLKHAPACRPELVLDFFAEPR